MNTKNNNSYTIKGLKTILIFYILMTIVTVIINLIQYSDDYKLISFILAIFVLVSLLMIYLGIKDIHKGKKEYGPEHEKSTIFSKKLVFWGIILYFIGFIFIIPSTAFIPVLYSILITLVLVPFWLALVYIIKDISSNKIRKLLWFAFFSRVILSFFSNYFFISIYMTIRKDFSFLNYDYSYLILLRLVVIIPSLIIIFCYYDVYTKLKNLPS